MIYVVGPTYAEFSDWLREEMLAGNLQSTAEVKYIRDHASLVGARLEGREDDIVCLPGWQTLDEAPAIGDYIEIMRAEFQRPSMTEDEAREELERIRQRMIETNDPFVECD